jgi:thioredoxin 1
MKIKMKELNADNFEKETSKGNWIIDFWAGWCGPCKMLAPEFESASKELKDVKFGKVNVDEEQDLAGKYGVMSLPSLLFFKDGQQVEMSVGLIDKNKILDIAKKAF